MEDRIDSPLGAIHNDGIFCLGLTILLRISRLDIPGTKVEYIERKFGGIANWSIDASLTTRWASYTNTVEPPSVQIPNVKTMIAKDASTTQGLDAAEEAKEKDSG